MRARLGHLVQTFNERFISEIAAFWRAAVCRLKTLFHRPILDRVSTEKTSLTIFLHGYLSDSSCWLPWMQYLRQHGYHVEAIDFGLDHPLRTIDELADRLDLYLRTLMEEHTDNPPKIHLVGHSMGGIVAATYALRKSPSVHVDSVVALAAPLKGARLARAAKWVFSKCGEDMTPNSPRLKELSELFDQTKTQTKFHYAAAKHDDIVPLDHVTLGGASAAIFPCNHMGIIYDAGARDWVEKVIQA